MARPSLLSMVCAGPALLASGPRIQAPDAQWRTISTAHYRIHYPAHPGFEAWALEIASQIEGIHAKVAEWVGFEAKGPIQVVLKDPVLQANGSALPLLKYPSVELWKTPPESDSAIGHFSSWTQLLVTHELAHIHHLMRPQSRPGLREKLFPLPLGPIVLKAPRWVHEGYATVIEGQITGSGRPHSAFRAAVLRQWARQGKLPAYDSLSGMEGFRGGSMAYLVGSAYLEWLERQNPQAPDILRLFWKQLASKKRRNFEESFKASFGMDPQDGYQRFCAELTRDAMEAERQLQRMGLREGEIYARFRGEVTDLAVSPDGNKLMARILEKKFKGLKVWDLAEKPESPKPQDQPDPNEVEEVEEVEDRAPEFQPRKAKWELLRIDGAVPTKPRWEGSAIQLEFRRPNAEGVLEAQARRWDPPVGGLEMAGAAPTPIALRKENGAWAVRHGQRWVPLPGEPIGMPKAQGADLYLACAIGGIWNLVHLTPSGEAHVLTRTASAAWNPAPTPDGKGLYYTQLSATGIEIRRLDLSQGPVETKALAMEIAPMVPGAALPVPDESSRLPRPVEPPESKPYAVAYSHWTSSRAAFAFTPSGTSYQVGLGGSDILGRLSWHMLGGIGTAPGPRGFASGLAWRGARWAPSLEIYSALERPSSQKEGEVRGYDRERRGAELAFSYRDRGATPLDFSPLLAWERVNDLKGGLVNRGLAGATLGISKAWSRGEWGTGLSLKARAGEGRTAGEAWGLHRAELGLRLDTPWTPFSFRVEEGGLNGKPGIYDRFHLGGLTTSLVAASLDWNRVEQAALPSHQATGDRLRRLRFDVGAAFRAYYEAATVWDQKQTRPDALRVTGLEFALHGDGSPLLGRFQLTLGVHRPLGGVLKHRTIGTISLVIRP